jgi:hypothetical protein
VVVRAFETTISVMLFPLFSGGTSFQPMLRRLRGLNQGPLMRVERSRRNGGVLAGHGRFEGSAHGYHSAEANRGEMHASNIVCFDS